MVKIKNNLLLLLNAFFAFTLLGLFLITNNQQVMAAPNEEFVGNMRIVNITVSNINILKNHATFKQYFDFKINRPCYNGNIATFAIMWKIKNPPRNLLGVFF